MSSTTPQPPSIPGFDFVRLLGSGRFADVHLYQQRFPRRLVAIKFIREDLLTWEAEHAFELEANVMASVSSHPCIVAIHDAGRSAGGHPYLVMEYCPLPTLAEQVKAKRFSVADALRIGVLLSGAVETAHAHGIVHRDIKPSNILMTDYGSPKLADFGIASSAWDRNAMAGFTPAWAPPEVITGEGIATAATDVYSIAATVYTLLAGHSPHIRPGGSGNSIQDIVARATARPTPSLPANVPPGVAAVLSRALSRTPGDRYQTARELGEALQHAQQELGLATTGMTLVEPSKQALPQTEGPVSRAMLQESTEDSVAQPSTSASRQRRNRLAVLAAVVALGAVAAVFASSLRNDVEPTTPSVTSTPTVTSTPSVTSTTGPVDIGIPYENQPCNGRWIVSLMSPAESVLRPKLLDATEGIRDPKYLKNRDSCEIFHDSLGGEDIYMAYTGPFLSFQQACRAKFSYPRPLAVIRHLSVDSPDRVLCFCLQDAENFPALQNDDDVRLPLDESLVADVQFVLEREGLNPDHLRFGNFSDELGGLLREYQSRGGLAVTGAIDGATLSAMRQDYCNG